MQPAPKKIRFGDDGEEVLVVDQSDELTAVTEDNAKHQARETMLEKKLIKKQKLREKRLADAIKLLSDSMKVQSREKSVNDEVVDKKEPVNHEVADKKEPVNHEMADKKEPGNHEVADKKEVSEGKIKKLNRKKAMIQKRKLEALEGEKENNKKSKENRVEVFDDPKCKEKILVEDKRKEEALLYLEKFINNRNEWKFKKRLQIWILRNIYYENEIDNIHYKYAIDYILNMSQKAKEETVLEANEIINKMKLEKVKLNIFKRAKKIFKILSKEVQQK